MNTRAIAARILNKLAPDGSDYEKVITREIASNNLTDSDGDLVFLLVKGVIQFRSRLDFILDLARTNSHKRLENKARNLLRLGVFQIVDLKIPLYAAVNETVAATRQIERPDLAPLVNGVLRHLPDERAWLRKLHSLDRPSALAIEYSHPAWLVKKWLEDFGADETVALLRFNNEYQDIFFRHNSLRIGWPDLEVLLTAAKFQIRVFESEPVVFFIVDRPGALLRSAIFQEGYCTVQDFTQSLAVRLLDPHEGETILDVCAAPGGKTGLVAQLTNNKAAIVANDRAPGKIDLIKESAFRLKIDSLNYSMADASTEKFPEVDKVLVDAPCTGTGVLARRADLRWNRRPEDLEKARQLQDRILNNVAAAVRPGGVMVYSTCSLEKEENWERADRFLADHPDFRIEPAVGWAEARFCDERGAIRILPFKHNLTGGFAVRLVRAIG